MRLLIILYSFFLFFSLANIGFGQSEQDTILLEKKIRKIIRKERKYRGKPIQKVLNDLGIVIGISDTSFSFSSEPPCVLAGITVEYLPDKLITIYIDREQLKYVKATNTKTCTWDIELVKKEAVWRIREVIPYSRSKHKKKRRGHFW